MAIENIEKQIQELNIKIDKIGEALLQLIDLLSDTTEEDEEQTRTLDGVLEGMARDEDNELG